MWELRLDKVEEKGGFHPMIQAAAKKVTEEHGVTVRNMRKRDLEAEIGRFLEVYNARLGAQLGLRAAERDRGPVLRARPEADPRRALDLDRRARRRGAGRRAVAARHQPRLAHMNGRLLPFGWAKFLWYRRKIEGVPGVRAGRQARVPGPRDRRGASTSSTSRRPTPSRRASGGARWAGSSRPTSAMNRAMEGMGGKIVQALPDLREGAGHDGGAESRTTWRPGARSTAWRSRRPRNI